MCLFSCLQHYHEGLVGTLLQSGDFSDTGSAGTWTDGETEEFVVGHDHARLDHLTAYGWVSDPSLHIEVIHTSITFPCLRVRACRESLVNSRISQPPPKHSNCRAPRYALGDQLSINGRGTPPPLSSGRPTRQLPQSVFMILSTGLVGGSVSRFHGDHTLHAPGTMVVWL